MALKCNENLEALRINIIKNPDHVSKGVKELIINGKSTISNVIPLLEKGKSHTVEIIMG